MQVSEAQKQRKRIAAHVQGLLGDDGVMMLPTAPGPAPKLKTPPEQVDLYRSRLLSLTCIAGLSELPQVSYICLAHLLVFVQVTATFSDSVVWHSFVVM